MPSAAHSKSSGGARAAMFSLLVIAAIACALSAPAVASQATNISGEVVFSELRVPRGSFQSSGLVALHGAGLDTPLVTSLSVLADEIVVQQNHSRSIALAGASGEDYIVRGPADTRTIYDTFPSAQATAESSAIGAEMLLLGQGFPSPHLSLSSLHSAVVEPAPDERWQTGYGQAEGGHLSVSYATIPGSPTATFSRPSALTVTGDFTLYLWSVNLNVTDAQSKHHEYRSGGWIENSTGPDGLPGPAESHEQLLAIHVRNGSLELSYQRGLIRLGAATLAASVDDKIVFDAERSEIEEDGTVRIRGRETLVLPGPLRLDVGASGQADYLYASLSNPPPETVDDASHDMPGDMPHAAPGPVDSATSGGDTVTRFSEPPLWLTLGAWTVLVVALGVAAAWFLIHRSGFAAWFRENLPPIVRAEQALFAGRHREARRRAKRILRQDPLDADAWMILGVALVHDGRYAEAVDCLAPAVSKIPKSDAGGIEYLLGLACTNLGRHAEAIRWLDAAGREAELLDRIRNEPAFTELRSHRAYQRLVAKVNPDAAYM